MPQVPEKDVAGYLPSTFIFNYLQIARFPVWWYPASKRCDRFRCMEEVVGAITIRSTIFWNKC